jgi:hypothetical protein
MTTSSPTMTTNHQHSITITTITMTMINDGGDDDGESDDGLKQLLSFKLVFLKHALRISVLYSSRFDICKPPIK